MVMFPGQTHGAGTAFDSLVTFWKVESALDHVRCLVQQPFASPDAFLLAEYFSRENFLRAPFDCSLVASRMTKAMAAKNGAVPEDGGPRV
jgi:hypothetical protein